MSIEYRLPNLGMICPYRLGCNSKTTQNQYGHRKKLLVDHAHLILAPVTQEFCDVMNNERLIFARPDDTVVAMAL